MSARVAIIEQCWQCRHITEFSYVKAGTWHQCDKRTGERGRVDPDAPPPDWCPLTKADDVAAVKPLAWERIAGAHAIHEYHECVTLKPRQYAVKTGPDGAWRYWDVPSNCWQPCDSLEDGKRQCEAHYRAALFGDSGPLVKIDAGVQREAEASK